MKVEEYHERGNCEDCHSYADLWGIYIYENKYPSLMLCKNCLLKLLKGIVER